jgi:hypothetical protein
MREVPNADSLGMKHHQTKHNTQKERMHYLIFTTRHYFRMIRVDAEYPLIMTPRELCDQCSRLTIPDLINQPISKGLHGI